MAISIRFNDHCLVRHLECKRIFEGSRICFVACPNSHDIALELEIIRQKLREVNIEPYIATDQREFQKDIFCEKICTKIIESQFCIVILNDVVDQKDNVRKPNANVYYEYGLMTAFRKRIIPVQLAGQSLAFNIQSLDTLKYQPKDFPHQIEEAIKTMLLNVEAEQKEKAETPQQENVLWALDLMGLVRDDRLRWRNERAISSRPLGFDPYVRPKDGRMYYVGVFTHAEIEKDIILRAKMLTVRIKNLTDQLGKELKEMKTSRRLGTFASERLVEQEKMLMDLLNAVILVAAQNIGDSVSIQRLYVASVKEVGLTLSLEVLEDSRIKELLTSDDKGDKPANIKGVLTANRRRVAKKAP